MKPLCANERNRCAPQARITGSISARPGARSGIGAGLGLGWREIDGVEQRRHRLADRGPVRGRVVPRRGQRLAQAFQARRLAQLEKPGTAQQRAQRRIAKRRPVELCQMRVAAARVEQHRIADVIERRAVLPGRQRAVGGTGEMLKTH